LSKNDRLIYRILGRIRDHGYYHPIDLALLEWFMTNGSVHEICVKYLVTPNAMYRQKSRIVHMKDDDLTNS